jgi:hypothetical protein
LWRYRKTFKQRLAKGLIIQKENTKDVLSLSQVKKEKEHRIKGVKHLSQITYGRL